MNLEKTMKNLEDRGFTVKYFPSGKEASDYLNSCIDGTSVGIGGCMTAEQLGLYDSLSAHNTVYWHWKSSEENIRELENSAPFFITSVNAISEDGQLLNIDGMGNRLAGMTYGKKQTYVIAGVNKLCDDFDSALSRVRNVAAVKNAARFKKNTPCQIDGKCHDCRSPERICGSLLVMWQPPMGMKVEVVLIGEELGY